MRLGFTIYYPSLTHRLLELENTLTFRRKQEDWAHTYLIVFPPNSTWQYKNSNDSIKVLEQDRNNERGSIVTK